MLPVRVKEFSLSTIWEYQLPRPFDRDYLHTLIREICASSLIGPFVVAPQIELNIQNELFAYTASIPIYNQGGSIRVNSQNLAIEFKLGRMRSHLRVMFDTMFRVLEIAKLPEVKRTVFSHSCHATFDSEKDYLSYMSRFIDSGLQITSGGVLWVVQIPKTTGELRYATEKSQSYPNGLFALTGGQHPGASSKEMLTSLSNCVDNLTKRDGVDFIFDDDPTPTAKQI
jgi:hypothetical protein